MMNYCIISKNTLSNCWISPDNALTSGVLSTRMEGNCSGSPSNMNFLPFKKGITAPGKPIAPDLSIKIRYIEIIDWVERARTLLFYASSGEIAGICIIWVSMSCSICFFTSCDSYTNRSYRRVN